MSSRIDNNPFLRFLDRVQRYGLEAYQLYYGEYRAEVLENSDPDGMGALIVRVPALGDSRAVRRKALPAPSFGGAGFGLRFTPPVGSYVWVRFEGGDMDHPVWHAGMWTRDGVPQDLRDPLIHGIVLRSGIKLLLDERPGNIAIRILHPSGARVEIDNEGNVQVHNAPAKQVTIGNSADIQPAVLGDSLLQLMQTLIDAILALTVPTGTGPSGPPINSPVFSAIKSRLREMLSSTVRVAR